MSQEVWCQRCMVVVSERGVCPVCKYDYAAPLPPEYRRVMRQVRKALRSRT